MRGALGITKRVPSTEFPLVYTTGGPANRTPAANPQRDASLLAQVPLRNRDPLGLGLPDVERRMLELCKNVAEQRLGLVAPAEPVEQHGPTDPRLAARKIGGDRLELGERLVVSVGVVEGA